MQTILKASNGAVVGETSRKRRFRFLPMLGVVGFIVIAIISVPAASRRAEIALTPQEQADKDLAQAVKQPKPAKLFLPRLTTNNAARRCSNSTAIRIRLVQPAHRHGAAHGVRMGDLNATQREAAFGLLATVLSKEGFQKVIDIMDATSN